MLTIDDVVKLSNEGVEVRFLEGCSRSNEKGLWMPDELEVRVFLGGMENGVDRDVTLLHELIHARNYFDESCSDDEDFVEAEALETYVLNYEVLEFVEGLYGL